MGIQGMIECNLLCQLRYALVCWKDVLIALGNALRGDKSGMTPKIQNLAFSIARPPAHSGRREGGGEGTHDSINSVIDVKGAIKTIALGCIPALSIQYFRRRRYICPESCYWTCRVAEEGFTYLLWPIVQPDRQLPPSPDSVLSKSPPEMHLAPSGMKGYVGHNPTRSGHL